MIHQKISYQIFLLAIGNVVPATDLSIFYLSKYINANLAIFFFVENLCYKVFH